MNDPEAPSVGISKIVGVLERRQHLLGNVKGSVYWNRPAPRCRRFEELVARHAIDVLRHQEELPVLLAEVRNPRDAWVVKGQIDACFGGEPSEKPGRPREGRQDALRGELAHLRRSRPARNSNLGNPVPCDSPAPSIGPMGQRAMSHIQEVLRERGKIRQGLPHLNPPRLA